MLINALLIDRNDNVAKLCLAFHCDSGLVTGWVEIASDAKGHLTSTDRGSYLSFKQAFIPQTGSFFVTITWGLGK